MPRLELPERTIRRAIGRVDGARERVPQGRASGGHPRRTDQASGAAERLSHCQQQANRAPQPRRKARPTASATQQPPEARPRADGWLLRRWHPAVHRSGRVAEATSAIGHPRCGQPQPCEPQARWRVQEGGAVQHQREAESFRQQKAQHVAPPLQLQKEAQPQPPAQLHRLGQQRQRRLLGGAPLLEQLGSAPHARHRQRCLTEHRDGRSPPACRRWARLAQRLLRQPHSRASTGRQSGSPPRTVGRRRRDCPSHTAASRGHQRLVRSRRWRLRRRLTWRNLRVWGSRASQWPIVRAGTSYADEEDAVDKQCQNRLQRERHAQTCSLCGRRCRSHHRCEDGGWTDGGCACCVQRLHWSPHQTARHRVHCVCRHCAHPPPLRCRQGRRLRSRQSDACCRGAGAVAGRRCRVQRPHQNHCHCQRLRAEAHRPDEMPSCPTSRCPEAEGGPGWQGVH